MENSRKTKLEDQFKFTTQIMEFYKQRKELAEDTHFTFQKFSAWTHSWKTAVGMVTLEIENTEGPMLTNNILARHPVLVMLKSFKKFLEEQGTWSTIPWTQQNSDFMKPYGSINLLSSTNKLQRKKRWE